MEAEIDLSDARGCVGLADVGCRLHRVLEVVLGLAHTVGVCACRLRLVHHVIVAWLNVAARLLLEALAQVAILVIQLLVADGTDSRLSLVLGWLLNRRPQLEFRT